MSKRELTPSEYEEMTSSRGKSSDSNNTKYAIILVSALVLCGISFWAGTSYQKGKQSNTVATAGTGSGSQNIGMGNGPGGGPGGGFGNGQRPNIGQVTVVSSDSISIQDSRSNSNQTFKITNKTTIQNNGATASASDIKSGDTALVIADSSDASTASQIMLNPSFNGGPQSGGN